MPNEHFDAIGYVDNLTKISSGNTYQKLLGGETTYDNTELIIENDGYLIWLANVGVGKEEYYISIYNINPINTFV